MNKGVNMRVSSISAAGQQQVVFNGSFSRPVKALLDSQTPNLLEAKRLGKFSKTDLKTSFDQFSRDYDVMRQKMGEFSYSTILSMEKTENGRTSFYIEHPKSDYRHNVGDVLLGEDLSSRLKGFSELAEMLKKLNPFEIEGKLCEHRYPNASVQHFIPEIKL